MARTKGALGPTGLERRKKILEALIGSEGLLTHEVAAHLGDATRAGQTRVGQALKLAEAEGLVRRSSAGVWALTGTRTLTLALSEGEWRELERRGGVPWLRGLLDTGEGEEQFSSFGGFFSPE